MVRPRCPRVPCPQHLAQGLLGVSFMPPARCSACSCAQPKSSSGLWDPAWTGGWRPNRHSPSSPPGSAAVMRGGEGSDARQGIRPGQAAAAVYAGPGSVAGRTGLAVIGSEWLWQHVACRGHCWSLHEPAACQAVHCSRCAPQTRTPHGWCTCLGMVLGAAGPGSPAKTHCPGSLLLPSAAVTLRLSWCWHRLLSYKQ